MMTVHGVSLEGYIPYSYQRSDVTLWTSDGSAAMRNGPWMWLGLRVFGRAAREQGLRSRHG